MIHSRHDGTKFRSQASESPEQRLVCPESKLNHFTQTRKYRYVLVVVVCGRYEKVLAPL